MKKYIPYIVILTIIGIAVYYGYSYMKKLDAVAAAKNRILSNSAERSIATARAMRNQTTVQYEAEQMAKQLV